MELRLEVVPISKIDLTKNVRTIAAGEVDADFAANVGQFGIQQPPVLQRCGDRYAPRCGGRRIGAAVAAGQTEVRALVTDEELSEADLIAIQLSENHHRAGLNACDEAVAIKRLMEASGCTAAVAAQRINYSESMVSKLLAVFEMPSRIQELIRAGVLPLSTAYTITRKGTPEQQIRRAEAAASGKLSRDQMARKLKRAKNGVNTVKLPGVLPGWTLAVAGRSVTLQALADVLTKAAERARLAVESKLSLAEFAATMKKAKPIGGGAQ